MPSDSMSLPFNPPLPGKAIGIGCDLVDVSRIQDAHERHGQHFLDKTFTVKEQKYCMKQSNPYPSLAARFAAKEAIAKAFTTGIGKHLGLQSMSISHGKRNEPLVLLDEKAQALLKSLGGKEVKISLSHTNSTAMAVALLTG